MKKQARAVRFITRGAAIAALYVGLTLVSAAVGLSSGVIQVRLSEALCLLPLFMPEAVAGLTVGCLLANLVTGCALWDVVFGSLATFIGAAVTRLFRNYFSKRPMLGTLPTVLANAVIVPFVLILVYLEEGAYLFFFATVGIGELVSAGLLGTLLYKKLYRSFAASRFLR